MRKKLPFCVGLLLRLLKKNHCVYITCTSGFDRSPSCVIAYLHWMTDTSLHAAHNFVTGLHTCRPDRFSSSTSIMQLFCAFNGLTSWTVCPCFQSLDRSIFFFLIDHNIQLFLFSDFDLKHSSTHMPDYVHVDAPNSVASI